MRWSSNVYRVAITALMVCVAVVLVVLLNQRPPGEPQVAQGGDVVPTTEATAGDATAPATVVKHVPTPTRTPLPLPAPPEGAPPEKLAEVLYLARTDAGPELRAIQLDDQGMRWGERTIAIDRSNEILSAACGLRLSPGGRWLAIDADCNGPAQKVYVVSAEGGEAFRPVPDLPSTTGPFLGWADDGSLLFLPWHMTESDRAYPYNSVVAVDVESREERTIELAAPADEQMPQVVYQAALSPDGQFVAYPLERWQDQAMYTGIWLASTSGDRRDIICELKEGVLAPSWSPSSTRLAYFRHDGSLPFEEQELHVLDVKTGADALLREGVAAERMGRGPAWSPDEKYLAFLRMDNVGDDPSDNARRGFNLYIIDVETGEERKLTDLAAKKLGYPQWSPNGRHLAVAVTTVDEDQRYAEVWIVPVDGGEAQLVANDARAFSPLSWMTPGVSQEVQ